MRSRYAAFAMGNADYLRATWHDATRPESIEIDPDQEWIGLKIKDATNEGNEAFVAFEARSQIGGRTHVLVECSRFVREDERWFYVAGDLT